MQSVCGPVPDSPGRAADFSGLADFRFGGGARGSVRSCGSQGRGDRRRDCAAGPEGPRFRMRAPAPCGEDMKKATDAVRRFLRRERDSNPRYSCPYTAFRVRPDRPLRHLSDRLPSPVRKLGFRDCKYIYFFLFRAKNPEKVHPGCRFFRCGPLDAGKRGRPRGRHDRRGVRFDARIRLSLAALPPIPPGKMRTDLFLPPLIRNFGRRRA